MRTPSISYLSRLNLDFDETEFASLNSQELTRIEKIASSLQVNLVAYDVRVQPVARSRMLCALVAPASLSALAVASIAKLEQELGTHVVLVAYYRPWLLRESHMLGPTTLDAGADD